MAAMSWRSGLRSLASSSRSGIASEASCQGKSSSGSAAASAWPIASPLTPR